MEKNTNSMQDKLVALFFADEGIILMQTPQETKKLFKCHQKVQKIVDYVLPGIRATSFYLITIINLNIIEDVPVTTNITYLGIKIQNKRDCYKLQRIEASKKAKKYSSMMPAVIAKRCNKLLIVKHIGKVQHYHQYYMEQKQFIFTNTF